MKGPTINIWIDKRKSLECAMIRKYLYNHKDHVIEISRGHNNKILPPTVWDICMQNYFYITEQQKAFSYYSRKIHNETYSERCEVEREIAKILNNSKVKTFKIVAAVRNEGVEETYYQYKLGNKNTPSKKILQRLKNLCNKFSELSADYHYKITPNEKAILKRLAK